MFIATIKIDEKEGNSATNSSGAKSIREGTEVWCIPIKQLT